MSDDALIETDRVPGCPHPRMAGRVIGHDAAVAEIVAANRASRLHHGWLISGPRGTGKATLAWAMAKWLLSGAESDDLTIPSDLPILHRVMALSEPRLHLLRRSVDERSGRVRQEITVDDVRQLHGFFHLSAAEGGRRIAIIDAAEDMNIAAANALLKLLEEPPRQALILMVTHQPGRLLPTIRSRCRELRLQALHPDAMARILTDLGVSEDAMRLSALSGGSAGEAMRLARQGGLELYDRLLALMADFPRLDRSAALALAEAAGASPGADGDPFDLMLTLLDRLLSRAARTGLHRPPDPVAAAAEPAVLTRMAPDERAARRWAVAQAELTARARAGRAVNLDPSALVLDMLIGLAKQTGA